MDTATAIELDNLLDIALEAGRYRFVESLETAKRYAAVGRGAVERIAKIGEDGGIETAAEAVALLGRIGAERPALALDAAGRLRWLGRSRPALARDAVKALGLIAAAGRCEPYVLFTVLKNAAILGLEAQDAADAALDVLKKGVKIHGERLYRGEADGPLAWAAQIGARHDSCRRKALAVMEKAAAERRGSDDLTLLAAAARSAKEEARRAQEDALANPGRLLREQGLKSGQETAAGFRLAAAAGKQDELAARVAGAAPSPFRQPSSPPRGKPGPAYR